MRKQPSSLQEKLNLLFFSTFLLLGFAVAGNADERAIDLFRDDQRPSAVREANFDALRSRYVQLDAKGVEAIHQGFTSLKFKLFPDVELTTSSPRIVLENNGQFSLVGSIDGDDQSYVILTGNHHVLVGVVQSGSRSYEIMPEPSGTLVVSEFAARDPKDQLDPLEVIPRFLKPKPAPRNASDDGLTIDLLVVYTAAAREGAGGTSAITTLIKLGQLEMNLSLETSNVFTRIRLVYTEEVPYMESGELGQDLFYLQEHLDEGVICGNDDFLHDDSGFLDEVQSLRDLHGADIVQLIVDHPHDCGVAFPLSSENFDRYEDFEVCAFSVVSWDCILKYHTLGHEIGHNLGLRHDRASAGTAQGAFPYSYGYIAPDESFGTMMASVLRAPRILRFSNPQVLYQGKPTGVPSTREDSADSAKSINDVRFVAANWRQSEDNNMGLADLVGIGEPDVNRNTNLKQGETIRVDFPLRKNGGDADAVGFFSGIVLSTDSVVDNSDRRLLEIGPESIPANSYVFGGGADVTIPIDAKGGQYWLGYFLDTTNTVVEDSEMNNGSNGIRISIAPLPDEIFFDDFETGNLLAWSSIIP